MKYRLTFAAFFAVTVICELGLAIFGSIALGEQESYE